MMLDSSRVNVPKNVSVFGTYTLVSVNDEELPYTDPEDGETVTDGSLNLRTDWSFAVSLTVLEGVQEPDTLMFLGTTSRFSGLAIHRSPSHHLPCPSQ